jgi:hypothetical protein
MAKKYDVIALGELLIDFTMNGQSEQGNNMYFGSRLSCGESPRRLDPWLCDIGFHRLCLFLYIRPFLRPHRNKNSYISVV